MAESVNGELILSIEGSRIYRLKSGFKEFLHEGTLNFVTTKTESNPPVELFLLSLESFAQNLNKNCTFMKVDELNYVIPGEEFDIGLVFPPNTERETVEVFEAYLVDCVVFRVAGKKTPIADLPDKVDQVATWGSRLAAGVAVGGKYLAAGILKGSQVIGSKLGQGSTYVIANSKPSDKPVEISETTKARLRQAKFATGVAVAVSKSMVSAAAAATSVLASQISEAASKTSIGQQISASKSARVEAMKDVARSTIIAAGEVYTAVQEAGINLAKDSGQAVSAVIEHKYGAEAGQAAREAAAVFVDMSQASANMTHLGVKSLAASTASKAAVELLTDEERKEQEQAASAANQSIDSSQLMGAMMLAGALQAPASVSK